MRVSESIEQLFYSCNIDEGFNNISNLLYYIYFINRVYEWYTIENNYHEF